MPWTDCEARRAGRGVIATAIALIATAPVLPGCGGPVDVSPNTFQLAQSIHIAARTKAADRIEMISAAVTEAAEAGEISGREADLLRDALASAEAGDWEEAAAESRRLMGDRR